MTALYNLGDLIPRDGDLSKTALIDLGGEARPRRFSFGAIDDMARAVARGLLGRGLKRGDRVAILSVNRAEYLASVFGIQRAGLVAVPVNFKFPKDTIAFIIADSCAKLVFCDQARREQCPAGLPVVQFGSSGEEAFDSFLNPGPFDSIHPTDREPAQFLYTSGSTGIPKGVVLSHQSHLWVTETRKAGQDLARHTYLIAAPMFHMNALSLSQLATASYATMVLLPQFNARDYINAIVEHRCTWLTAVPPMIAMMLREQDLVAAADLSSVEFIRMGSAPVTKSLMTAMRRTLPKAVISNVYGTTESGPIAFGSHPAGLPIPEMSVGYPHPKVQVALVDGANVDADSGELHIKTPALMNGYHNRPDLSAAISPNGFYATGDVFSKDKDGFFFFVGRVDDMFVCGGENIYPSEVEQLLERHQAVAQACIVPVDDEIKGQKPVAFVVLREGASATEDELKQFALAHAPAYQHPRSVWFLDQLPLASTNKIDRTALKRQAADRLAGRQRQ